MADTRIIDVAGTFSEDLSSVRLEHVPLVRRIFQPWKDRRLLVKVQLFQKRRSLAQNRYIHGPVVTCVSAFLLEKDGWCPNHDGVYALLRQLCGDTLKVETVMGHEVISFTGKRFSQMSTVEFNESIEFLKKYFDKRGCHIPDPKGDNLWTDYGEE